MKSHPPVTVLLILVGVLAYSSCWAADNEPITINNSVSPDGKKDIVIVPGSEDTGVAAGTAKIRDIKTGHTLGSFQWSGFGGSPDAFAFKVLWRPDSKCFSISYELTRGFMACAIYAEFKSVWSQVKLPDFFKPAVKMSRAAGAAHVIVHEDDLGGKGHETPREWLADGSLLLDTGYRGMKNIDITGGGDSEQLFVVTLQITKGAKSKAVIKSVEFAPASAYPH